MRIAIAGQTYLPGNNGQAIFTIHLAEGLVRAGHQVHVITGGDRLQYQRKEVNGVVVHLLPSLGFTWLHPGAYFTGFSTSVVQRIFAASHFDIVHVQDHYFLCRDVAAVARRQHIPILGTNHFLPGNLLPYLKPIPLSEHLKTRILWDLMLETYNSFKLVTTPTETAARILGQQKIHVPIIPISCGVDTRIFYPIDPTEQASLRIELGLDPQKITFLYVGRHDPEKRIDLILYALAQLRDEGMKDLQLVLAGRGVAKDELEALAKDLKIESQVLFFGYFPAQELPRLFQAADIFVMPSPEELQSIATLEAMASGKPVLAANARALPELVTHWVNGLLFEPGQPASIANMMAEFVKNPLVWKNMGKVSRSRALSHSLESTVKRYEAVYQKVCDKQPYPYLNPTDMRLRTAGHD